MCTKHQDVARIDLFDLYNVVVGNSHIDSIVMKATGSDSIIGCIYYAAYTTDARIIGSKIHRIKFPLDVRLQLFSQGSLQEELFFNVDKKTVSKISNGSGCSAFARGIQIFLTNDYCLYSEKMSDSDYEHIGCLELSVDGKTNPCYGWQR
jgi:hypothetical protein